MSSADSNSASAMRHTFITSTPSLRLPTSLASAANVHDMATPRDISSPKYLIIEGAKLHIFCEI